MTKKELDQLYNTALSYHIGKGGEEVNIMLAMDYYDEYLENATEKHLHLRNSPQKQKCLKRALRSLTFFVLIKRVVRSVFSVVQV
jgi:hypothetical protein